MCKVRFTHRDGTLSEDEGSSGHDVRVSAGYVPVEGPAVVRLDVVDSAGEGGDGLAAECVDGFESGPAFDSNLSPGVCEG